MVKSVLHVTTKRDKFMSSNKMEKIGLEWVCHSPTFARPLILIELIRCVDRMKKEYMSQVCKSEFCLLRYKNLLIKVDALYIHMRKSEVCKPSLI